MNRIEKAARTYVRRSEERGVPAAMKLQWRELPAGTDSEWRGRLHRSRTEVVPWLARGRDLTGARLLEVGSGEGASTFALCEQGASVVALDTSADALESASRNLTSAGLNAEFVVANAADLASLELRTIDWVIFWASLEHMTLAERLASLQAAWEMLQPGGALTVVETPNRLWPFDSHTSSLPFFNWMPDDAAFRYARQSLRDGFGGDFYSSTEQFEHFLRRGRGVSYHDFELAIGDLSAISTSSMQIARRRRNLLRATGWRLSWAGRTERVLGHFAGEIDRAWLQPFLYLTLTKD